MDVSETPSEFVNPVIDVWSNTFDKETLEIQAIIKQGFTIISIDTEYPGVIHKQKYNDRTTVSTYNTMKSNVDKLKPIQLGISLSSPDGSKPQTPSIWQFNFKFDSKEDRSEPKSIQLLEKAKISFKCLLERGIEHETFCKWFMNSCLHANPELTWLSFHGAYDFAYLIKLATGKALPESLKGFNELRKSICPSVYDVKMLIQTNETFKNYSLFRLAQIYKIPLLGTLHQAGTDACLTLELFFRVKESLLVNKIKKFENKLYGLSKMFSIESVEFGGQKNKVSLKERIIMTKAMKEIQESDHTVVELVPTPIIYGVYMMPVYYNYYGMGYDMDMGYRGG